MRYKPKNVRGNRDIRGFGYIVTMPGGAEEWFRFAWQATARAEGWTPPPEPPKVLTDEERRLQAEAVRKALGLPELVPIGPGLIRVGGHVYDEHGTSDCRNGCGCWAGPSRSGGPDGLDPFGACPKAQLMGPGIGRLTAGSTLHGKPLEDRDMNRRMIGAVLLALVLAMVTTWAGAAAGVRGTATISPTCFGPELNDPCTAAYVGDILAFDVDGNLVAWFSTDDTGTFQLDLDPGDYVFNRPMAPSWAGIAVTVNPDSYTDVLFEFDSGIR